MNDLIYSAFVSSTGVNTDSRKLTSDGVFFALKGDRFNGNDYVLEALHQGCILAVADEDRTEFKGNKKIVVVENALRQLQILANHHRRKLKIPIIALTGSNGKTTTKELLFQVLSSQYNCAATEGNLNNHIGVPLTLLQISHHHEIAIIEMGANHRGEIHQLCEIAEPGYGLITNIGLAHLEGFGGPEGVYEGKREMFTYLLEHEGMLFINMDDAKVVRASKGEKGIGYGAAETALYQGRIVSTLQPTMAIEWWRSDLREVHHIQTNLAGNYNFQNAMAAIAVGRYFGVAPEKVKSAIEQYRPDNNRSQIKTSKRGNTLIIDCYNANPSSMKAAIENLAASKESKALILGDMLELGEFTHEEHMNIKDLVERHIDTQVFLIGPMFSSLALGASSNIKVFESVAAFTDFLNRSPLQHQTILLKGSRGMRLEQLIPLL